ncbi:iron-containing redox enzyme family protein [Nocardia inohanensis]|uniref:iron-containing redox enzyme family protein n=1 Tax=Nocardia inohanensis TaxID=209246 RepID=UPI00082FF3CC|nr:iron-containing redox enzyme family protein [Nocardia inohanensis]
MSPDASTRPRDTTTSLPPRRFEFSHAAVAAAERILAGGPEVVWRELLVDQESEAGVLVARRIVGAFLDGDAGSEPVDVTADIIAAEVDATRARLRPLIGTLRERDPDTVRLILRQRAPLTLLDGCWNDIVSQPATQPAAIVNRLLAHEFSRRGAGEPGRSAARSRRRALAAAGVFPPELTSRDFPRWVQPLRLTMQAASWYLALSRLPANFLPEIVAVHYAFGALAVDDHLLGRVTDPRPDLDGLLDAFLADAETSCTAIPDTRRLLRAVRLVLRLETEHVRALVELADWHQGQSLDARVGRIFARHAPYAGSQHGAVRLGGELLSDTLGDPELDVAQLVSALRRSGRLRPRPDGGNRFLDAIAFGGPMFGIFDADEVQILTAWSAAVAAGDPEGPAGEPCTAGEDTARHWDQMIAAYRPADVEVTDPVQRGGRELFHRLVNIENYPNTLVAARDYADRILARAQLLWDGGEDGTYTDASFFDYSPEALLARVERIYWTKLVDPYRPLAEIPARETVIDNQKRYALAALVDGAWLHRVGNAGRFDRPGVAALYAIHADEMGNGDLAENHLTLIGRVLDSMSIALPHIREPEFVRERELPELSYAFANYQLSLGLFPDSRFPELLGLTLGIELFGLGELRLHEIQKLRHHGFDPCYEQAHLTVDNVSAGHARQAAEIINSHLGAIGDSVGPAAVAEQWRRVWRGYASFALFVEAPLVRKLMARHAN